MIQTELAAGSMLAASATDSGAVRQGGRGQTTVTATELKPTRIEWFWPGRIPFGALTVIGGQPGLGKSLLTLKLVADLTQGRLTDGLGNALLLSAEDAREQVVMPRLFAAGAHMSRVHFDNVHEEGLRRQLFLPDDVPLLAEMVREHDAQLVVIDPLSAHLPGKVNTWQDQSVRLALAPVAQLAETTGAAVVVVSHLNKSQSTEPLQRLGGSIGLAAAARSVLLLARDPDDPQGETGSQRVLAQVKSNFGPTAESLRYLVESERLDRLGRDIIAPKIRELGRSPHIGSDLLTPIDPAPAGAIAEAIRFLQEELADGPKPASQLQETAEAAGLSWDTVKRAKQRAGVSSDKQKGVANGRWLWTLAEPAVQNLEAGAEGA